VAASGLFLELVQCDLLVGAPVPDAGHGFAAVWEQGLDRSSVPPERLDPEAPIVLGEVTGRGDRAAAARRAIAETERLLAEARERTAATRQRGRRKAG